MTYFAIELSTPVDPDKSKIEYLPTQYISEYIKSRGFDGIMFNSAMGSGFNIVLFNENKAEIKKIETFVLNNIIYDYDYE